MAKKKLELTPDSLNRISFSPPDITQLEIDNVCDTLRSGWITTGPKTKELEKKLANFVGVSRMACLNSATSALELGLRILGIGPGDEVIVPAYTYTASASVIEHVGAKIVFIDSQKDSIEMDYDAMEAAINHRTKAVIPVDIGGVPCDYDRIFEIVRSKSKKRLFEPKNKLQVIIGRCAVVTDAAHALGAKLKYDGKWCNVGQCSDMSSFSFHAVKNLTTAEGGALAWSNKIATNDDAVYNCIQLYSLHGQSKDALSKNRFGSWEYDIMGTWYKYNMTDIMASIGLGQLDRYPDMLKRRKEIIGMYDAAFKPLGVKVLDHYNDMHQSSGHLYITNIPGITDMQRRSIIIEMARRGIATNVHYKPLPMMTAYRNMGFDIKDFPNAKALYENEITLPLYTRLTDEEVQYVIENYTDILKNYL